MSPLQSCLDRLQQLDGEITDAALHGAVQLAPLAVKELVFGLTLSSDGK